MTGAIATIFAGRRWSLETASIGHGKSGRLEASVAECQSVGSVLGLLACSDLAFDYDIRPATGQRFRLKARLSCNVVQASVVSLEPVPGRIAEEAESELVAEDTATLGLPEGETDILNAPVIETYAGGRIDLGQIAFELLSVSLDPYPRKDGEALTGDEGLDKSVPSPFAALAVLRKPPGGG
jgi:hypothetical protein